MEQRTGEPRIAALLTSHNRRALTVACLERLQAQRDVDATLHIVLLDAASTDGTAEAIERRFANATVLRGHADQFWNRGMHAAFAHAVETGSYQFYLWLNDDTLLDDDAVATLLETNARVTGDAPTPAIVVGATRDPDTGEHTYGGMRRSDGGRPLRFARVPLGDRPQAVDTLNGNCVLVPQVVVERIGIIDPAFFHGLGDFDYGLRATGAGCSVWQAPGTVGTCKANTWPAGRWNRIKSVFGRKRLRLGEWYVFVRRWGGRQWPVLVFAPYVRHALMALTAGDGDP